MNLNTPESILKKLIEDSQTLDGKLSTDPEFKVWKETVTRRLKAIYGENSQELIGFNKIQFIYAITRIQQQDKYNTQLLGFVKEGLQQSRLYFLSLIEDLALLPKKGFEETGEKEVSRIFISHASKDKEIVSEIVQMLSLIGITDASIFCTSLDGYGIPFGEDWLQTIKKEINSEVVVLFVLSTNYYESIISICEMGAAWALSKRHIPILVPPFEFSDVKGVIPMTQGFKLNDGKKWSTLKSQLEEMFNLSPKTPAIWESRRDEILKRIEVLLPK